MFKRASLSLFLLSSSAASLCAQTDREAALLQRIEKLEQRLAALEGGASTVSPTSGVAASTPAIQQTAAVPAAAATQNSGGFFSGTTFNLDIDGYYGYNFNRPIGRVNLLRANDVLSNNFSLNQAGIVIERTPDVSPSKRLGYRLDLMFGQNTETLQGGTQNEARPQVYRNIFQAYGTVVVPFGKGVTVDFGKFSSSLGYEGNYAKDQINYSRSYYFNYLPFYHMGTRATYAFNDKVSLQYWLVNGANQTEDFNGFKSNAFLLTLKPTKAVSWNVNYYFGQEGRDSTPLYNPGLPALPTQPGLSTDVIRPVPDGKQHIFDTYAAWNATNKLTLVAEADYVVSRNFHNSSPARVTGAVGYAKYQFNNAWALAGRFGYLSDRGGLFTGTTQALKETTVTATYQFADGLQLRGEYRGDFSNQRFFLTDTPGLLKRRQDTASLGVIYWLGSKQGSW